MPPVCGGCGSPGVRWCDKCQASIERLPETICPICGQPRSKDSICFDCRETKPPIKFLRSYAYFKGPFRSAIHRIKYNHDFGMTERFTSYLLEMFQNELRWQIDAVTVVPLSQERFFERGYNQTALLGKLFARGVNKPYISNLLRRQRNTASQVGLSKNERRINIQDAFVADEKKALNQSILIIDDVTTTGATIMECARALKDQGASEIFGLTLAKTPYNSDKSAKINENLI